MLPSKMGQISHPTRARCTRNASLATRSLFRRHAWYATRAMPDNPLVDLLAKQSTARLQAMQREIQTQILDLQLQARWVSRALAGKHVPSPSAQENASHESDSGGSPQARRRVPGSTGDVIREIINAPGRVWQPSEVVQEAHNRGLRASPPAIRVALRRLGNSNYLKRGPNGTGWQLASANGSSPSEPPPDALSLGLGGMGGETPWPHNDGSG